MSRSPRVAAIVPAVTAALVTGAAGSAQAAQPAGACPLPFEYYTTQELFVYATEVAGLDPVEAQAQIAAILANVDANGDAVVCVAFQNKVQPGANIIDNVAARGDLS